MARPITAGDGSGLSGYNFYHAIALPVQIFGVPLELLGVRDRGRDRHDQHQR